MKIGDFVYIRKKSRSQYHWPFDIDCYREMKARNFRGYVVEMVDDQIRVRMTRDNKGLSRDDDYTFSFVKGELFKRGHT